MAQTVTPDFLTTVPAGWSYVGSPTVIRQIAASQLSQLQLDGYEWFDVSGLGIGGTQVTVQAAVQRFRTQVQLLGSDLYAYALIRKSEININVLGLQVAKVDRYRLILVHSQAQALAWFLVILGAALTTIILFQYVTTGQSPTLQAVSRMWSNLVQAAVGPVGPAVAGSLVPILAAVGGVALLVAYGYKQGGIPPPRRIPSVQVGVKSKHATAGVRT